MLPEKETRELILRVFGRARRWQAAMERAQAIISRIMSINLDYIVWCRAHNVHRALQVPSFKRVLWVLFIFFLLFVCLSDRRKRRDCFAYDNIFARESKVPDGTMSRLWLARHERESGRTPVRERQEHLDGNSCLAPGFAAGRSWTLHGRAELFLRSPLPPHYTAREPNGDFPRSWRSWESLSSSNTLWSQHTSRCPKKF